MLPLLNASLDFGPSQSFLKWSLGLYLLTVYMLWCSGLALWVQALATLFIVIQGFELYKNPYPCTAYQKLIFENGKGRLWDKRGNAHPIDQHAILFTTAFFFVMQVHVEGKRTKILNFFDQLKIDDYKILKCLEKI